MYNLVGKQILDFNGNDGKPVKGIKLHFTDDTREEVQGAAAVTQFFKVEHACYQKALTLPFGEFDIKYGYGGRILDLIPLNGK